MIYAQDIKNRLRRVEGQIRGVLQMMEEQKSCEEVAMQLTAVRTAVEKATLLMVSTHLEDCIRKEVEQGNSAKGEIEAAIQLMMRSK